MIPVVGTDITYDAKLDDAAPRIINKAGKDAMREVLLTHHRERIPEHFKATNRGKYSHRERTARYKAIKMRRFKSRTDLVKTGRTRDRMTSLYQIRIGGSQTGSETKAPGLVGRLLMRFPFPESKEASPDKVNTAQMRREIETITDGERQEIVKQFRDLYVKHLTTTPSGRKRRPRRKQ